MSTAPPLRDPTPPPPSVALPSDFARTLGGETRETRADLPGTPGASGDPSPTDPDAAPPGRYHLHQHLGSGGMGTVWKAWDSELNRDVALKLMKRKAAKTPEWRARFLREARTMARLRFPGIVPIHDVGECEDCPYLAMAYIPGTTLDARLRGAGKPAAAPDELRVSVEILAKVADALQHAHDHGVVHRDLKPANVLLDRKGEPWVADFGLAREMDVAADASALLTVAGVALGTPAYMSPEQACGEHASVGPRADVWAMGVILYEMLTGHTPFERGSALECMRAAVQEPLEPARRWNPAAPAALESVCRRALAKAQEDRYASAREFADDLRRWLRGQPVVGDSTGRMRRGWRRLGRHRPVVGAAALTALLVVAAVAWGLHQRDVARARIRALMDEIRHSVLRFQDDVFSRELPPEAKVALAGQPLDLVNRRIQEDPADGATAAWRGELQRLQGRDPEADADFDRGCALSPQSPVVWYLRGMARLQRHAALRDLPGATVRSARLTLEAVRDETEAERTLRLGGLSDLARMEACPPGEESFAGHDARLGRAMAALFSESAEGPGAALRGIEGLDVPIARWLKAMALYRLERFEEAHTAFGALLEAWPRQAASWIHRALAGHAVGLARAASGEDPREWFRRAVADAGAALEIAGPRAYAFTVRALAHAALAEANAARGQDPIADCRNAVADFRAALAAGASEDTTANNLGNALKLLAQAQAARGLDPGESLRLALAAFDAAIERAPRNAGIRSNRGGARLELAQREAAQGADPRDGLRQAIDDFTTALTLDPELRVAAANRAPALRMLAEALAARGEDPRETFRLAVEDFTGAMASDPGQAIHWNERGTALFSWAEAEAARGGDPGELRARAERDYRVAIERGVHAAHLNLGVFCAALGRWEEALAEFETGVRLAPAYAEFARPRIENARRMVALRARHPDDRRWMEAMSAARAGTGGDLRAARRDFATAFVALQERLAVLTPAERKGFFAEPQRNGLLRDANYDFAGVLALLSAGHRTAGDVPGAVSAPERASLHFLAFGHLGKALDHGFADLARLRQDPAFDALRADERWSALLARMGK